MKLITKDTDYAMRALTYMAKNNGEINSVKEISESLNISLPYLRKILQILTKRGILSSSKGKGGGFTFDKSPDKIYIIDLINIFQGEINIRHCVVREDICPNITTCLLHKKLFELEKLIKSEINLLTIKALI